MLAPQHHLQEDQSSFLAPSPHPDAYSLNTRHCPALPQIQTLPLTPSGLPQNSTCCSIAGRGPLPPQPGSEESLCWVPLVLESLHMVVSLSGFLCLSWSWVVFFFFSGFEGVESGRSGLAFVCLVLCQELPASAHLLPLLGFFAKKKKSLFIPNRDLGAPIPLLGGK